MSKTVAAELEIRHTGAGSHRGAQSDPAASLGGHVAADRAGGMGFRVVEGSRAVRIDYASLEHPEGVGVVEAVTDDRVHYRAPGDSAFGPDVALPEGVSRPVPSDSPAKYLRLTRETADDLTGIVASIELLDPLHNAIALDEVTDAERSGGNTDYRAVGVINLSAHPITGILAWSPNGSLRLGWESPDSQPGGTVQTIADPDTAPDATQFDAGAWSSPTTEGDAIAPDTPLEPGWWYALWTERSTSAGASAATRTLREIALKATGRELV